MTKPMYSAAEIAQIIGVSERWVRNRADNERWASDYRIGRGGKKLMYYSALLPEDVRAALQASLLPAPVIEPPGVSEPNRKEAARRLAAVSAVMQMAKDMGEARARQVAGEKFGESAVTLYRWKCVVAGLPEDTWLMRLVPRQNLAAIPADMPRPQELAGWQRRRAEARLAILREVERLAEVNGQNQAIAHVVALANKGELPEPLQALVAVANARSSNKPGASKLSRATVFRWKNAAQKGFSGLAPKAKEINIPAWFCLFRKYYCTPTGRSVPHAIRKMEKNNMENLPIPTESQVNYFLRNHFSVTDIQKGRLLGSNLRAIRGFIRRDTSNLLPLDVVVCDGHSFKARVAHPVHSRPFHPEVCGVIDAATRLLLGWSAGLAESRHTVADALRHSMTVTPDKPYGGVPAILYTDKGAGNTAKSLDDPVTGMLSRMGVTHHTGRPGNPQARGLVEITNKTIWIPAAKELPTCTHKDVDSTFARKVYLKTLKDIRESGQSELLISWPDFLNFLVETVWEYNNRPHSALPKVTDRETGRKRHMTPMEMWAVHLAEGWRPDIPEEDELEEMFRPCILRTVIRCEVKGPAGNIYYSRDLEHYNGKTVRVHYDIHDASRVWVRDGKERLICIAEFGKNTRDYMPIPEVEQCREERKRRKLALLEQKVEDAWAESREAIRVNPAPKLITHAQEQAAEEAISRFERELLPANDWEKYAMLLGQVEAGQKVEAQDAAWMADYEKRVFGEPEKRLAL